MCPFFDFCTFSFVPKPIIVLSCVSFSDFALAILADKMLLGYFPKVFYMVYYIVCIPSYGKVKFVFRPYMSDSPVDSVHLSTRSHPLHNFICSFMSVFRVSLFCSGLAFLHSLSSFVASSDYWFYTVNQSQFLNSSVIHWTVISCTLGILWCSVVREIS